jgi:hypothetical protein
LEGFRREELRTAEKQFVENEPILQGDGRSASAPWPLEDSAKCEGE